LGDDAGMIWNDVVAMALAENVLSENKTLISIAYKGDDEFIASLENAIHAAALSAGYDPTILDSKNSAGLQLTQMESARKNGEKSIIVNLVDPAEAPRLLEAAGDLKVVLVNRAPLDMSLLGPNSVYVGSDESEAGRLQGEWLAKHFKEQGVKEIRYLLLQGPTNLPSTVQRTESVLKALGDAGMTATEAAPPIVADYNRSEALYKIFPVLKSGVPFDVIISNNDAMALGAIQALESLGEDPAKTPVVGIDATEPAVQALLAGKLAMTVFQDAEAQGKTAITALTNLLEGKPVRTGIDYPVIKNNPYNIRIPFEPVTKDHFPKNLHFQSFA